MKELKHDSALTRVKELANFNIDIAEFGNALEDLATLAATITGAEISLINILDATTQWTISQRGLDIQQMPVTESVCQYTIAGDEPFEVKGLSSDVRFHDKFYVKDDPYLDYYFGVPLKSGDVNVGALCVLSKTTIEVSPAQQAMLQLVAHTA